MIEHISYEDLYDERRLVSFQKLIDITNRMIDIVNKSEAITEQYKDKETALSTLGISKEALDALGKI